MLLNPMRNLGASLMQYYAWGSIWALGYLVQPMFRAKFAQSEQLAYVEQLLKELLQINLLLSFVCLAIYSLSQLKTQQWKIKNQTGIQLALASLILIICYFIFNKSQPQSLGIIYGLLSLIGVAQVSFSQPRTQTTLSTDDKNKI